MYATIQKRRLIYVVCVVILVLVAATALAAPKFAEPPVGTWSGQLDDETVVILTVTADGGLYLQGVSTTPANAMTAQRNSVVRTRRISRNSFGWMSPTE